MGILRMNCFFGAPKIKFAFISFLWGVRRGASRETAAGLALGAGQGTRTVQSLRQRPNYRMHGENGSLSWPRAARSRTGAVRGRARRVKCVHEELSPATRGAAMCRMD